MATNPPVLMEQFESAEKTAEALNFTEILHDCLITGVLAVDCRFRICAFNAGAERLTGVSADLAMGGICDILPAPLSDFIHETFAARSTVSERELFVNGSDATERILKVTCACCVSENGNASGVVLVLNDLASAHKLGLNMQRLDRLASIGTLSASMAHEIKNALVAVSTFVQDLVDRNKDAELAGLVGREFRRIDSIVSQMLKFAGPARSAFSTVSLHRVLDQSLRLIHPQLEAKQIQLRRSFAAARDRVDGDEYQMEQALLNVFLNAIAAMEPRGQLSVSTKIADAVLSAKDAAPTSTELSFHLTIADTGAGIAPENLSRLFEPFFSTKPNGTGLGLPITRRIILEHRGQINVESELGKGTTFTILLPLIGATPPP